MQLTDDLLHLLHTFSFSCLNSNFLLSNLNQILFAATDKLDNYYMNKYLSDEIYKLEADLKNKSSADDLFITLNKAVIPIIKDDSTNYSAQMIFPIFVNNRLDGFLYFFRTYGDYISSSSKAPKTIKQFIEKHLNDKITKNGG